STSVDMALLVCLFAGPALVAELALSRRRASLLAAMTPVQRREMFYSSLITGLDAAKEIRLFGLGTFLRQRMLDERPESNRAARALDRHEFAVHACLATTSALVAGGGLIWAIQAAGRGSLTLGDVSIFSAAVLGMQSSLTGLFSHLATAHQHLIMFEQYQQVL